MLFLLMCFSIVITSLEEERANLRISRAIICLFCMRYFVIFPSSIYRGFAATRACGTPWAFLLTF